MGNKLLKNVCYISRIKPEEIIDLHGNKIKVSNTFPYNPESKTSPATALHWALRYNQKDVQPVPITLPNDPFEITIVSLESRSEGGRAYKVIDDSSRLFDLREDQVIEVIRSRGLHRGGRIPGQFVWGIAGSQVKLVLVGGELHTEMVEASRVEQERAAASKPAFLTSGFVVGGVYTKADGSKHLYIGKAHTASMKKPMHAFVHMPEKPTSYDHDNWDVYDRHVAGSEPLTNKVQMHRAASKNWENMSWFDRCRWEWYESNAWYYTQCSHVSPGYYDTPAPITFLSSPKFVSADDFNSIDEMFAQAIRRNSDAEHRYHTGHGEDLAVDAFVQRMNRWDLIDDSVRREATAKFRDSLTWWSTV